MKSQLNFIVENLTETLFGAPWFGKNVLEILHAADPARVYDRPGNNPHSQADLLYHMITWTEFTRDRMKGEPIDDMPAFDAMDWRVIDPGIHEWQAGIDVFRRSNEEILVLLNAADESMLTDKVEYRQYDFHYLLNGLIQHHIYHTGQLVYLQKTIQP